MSENKDQTFNSNLREICHELLQECLNDNNAELSNGLRNKIENSSLSDKKQIVNGMILGDSPISAALQKGNIKICEYLMMLPGAQLERKESFFNMAILSKDVEKIKFLIEHGTDINTRDERYLTPLHTACELSKEDNDYIDIVEYLLENGADVSMTYHNGITCLMKSIHNVQLCKLLLRYDDDVNKQDNYGYTALHYAAAYDALETFLVLLRSGGDINIRSFRERDVLTVVCLDKAENVFNFIMVNFNLFDISYHRIADSYELLGSSYATDDQMQQASYCWKTAANFRHIFVLHPKRSSGAGYHLSIPEMERYCLEIFENSAEFNHYEEIDERDIHEMKIQSVLVRKRFLGLHEEETVCSYLSLFHHCISIGVVVNTTACAKELELFLIFNFIKKCSLFLTEGYYEMLKTVAESMIATLSQLNPADKLLHVQMIVNELEYCRNEISNGYIRTYYNKKGFNLFLYLLLKLFISIHQDNDVTEAQKMIFKSCLKEAMLSNPKNCDGQTLLHLVLGECNKVAFNEKSIYYSFIKLLIKCGCDVNAADNTGSGPIIHALDPKNYNHMIVELLLKANANPYATNNQGQNAIQLLEANPESKICLKKYKIWSPPSLLSITGKFVIKNKIPYLRDDVPKVLQDYLNEYPAKHFNKKL